MPTKSARDSPILVTGAAGAVGSIGRKLTQILLAKGHKVRALVRREDDRAESLRQFGAEVMQGDLTDLTSMHRAIEGCQRIYFGMSGLARLSGGHSQHRRGGAPSRRPGLRPPLRACATRTSWPCRWASARPRPSVVTHFEMRAPRSHNVAPNNNPPTAKKIGRPRPTNGAGTAPICSVKLSACAPLPQVHT